LSYRGTAQAGTVLATAASSLANPSQKFNESQPFSELPGIVLIEEDLDISLRRAIVGVPEFCAKTPAVQRSVINDA
jgi:hypothetical protein